MFYIFLKAILIGMLSSAPMGPVGMLCIQRTLNDGRKSGLMTGFGASVGDMIFALLTIITALGLGFNTAFLEEHEVLLQTIGSIVLFIFGTYIYNKNPSKSLTKFSKVEVNSSKIFLSSLGLTLSNLTTLFLYIALFTRFNVIDADKPFYYCLLTILFIGSGAMLWWFFITYVVTKLRQRFNPRGLKIFNRITGTIFVVIAIVGLLTAAYMQLTGEKIF